MRHLIRSFTAALALLTAFVFSTAGISAEPVAGAPEKLELAVPFTDHMILQRNEPVSVWGFAPPGEKVTVEFAGQKKSAKADRRGDWMLQLDPLEASAEGREFTVTAGSQPEAPITLTDVLVGEVWFSSGQSNMVWIAGKSMVRDLARELARAELEVPIREINIQTVSALYPQKRATSDGGWKQVNQAEGFSALSLAFAHELYQELGVPIGILLSAHSNTRVEAFTQREAIAATTEPLTLQVETSKGSNRTVEDVLVGDVWYLTGGKSLTHNFPYDRRDKNAEMPEALPHVREFRRRTKASTNPRPRKRYFEAGGGKYSSSWANADFTGDRQEVTEFAYHFAKALDRPGIPQGFITMSSGEAGRETRYASPLAWTSFAGVKDIDHAAFEERMNELMLQYPGSKIARAAVDEYIAEVKGLVRKIIDLNDSSADLAHTAPLGFPLFPKPGKEMFKANTVPTYTYNWCVTPLTPMAVSAVIWVPESYNLGENPAEYATELEIYAKSLPGTFGHNKVPFIYAQPTAALVEGITEPSIPGAKKVSMAAWPESVENLAKEMAGKFN